MLNIGYAQEIITPPVGVGLAGYMNKRPNLGMYDDLYAKTIVFCVDIEHAERMRQALLQYAPPEITAKTDKYIVRITGDDPIAKGYLEDFINPEETYPVIATTSKLMTTGTNSSLGLTKSEQSKLKQTLILQKISSTH
mgnify:CR=1 FL=1